MKYWLLTIEYPPQFGGGIGTYCAQWSELAHRNGVAVTVFTLSNQVETFAVRIANGIRVVEFSPYFFNSSAYLGYETMISYSFAAIIDQFMKEEGVPDWLEAHEYNGIAYYILQKKHLGYALFKKLPVVITCHCPSFFTFRHNHINTYQLPYFWIGEMERFTIKAADVCIAPSQYLVDQLLQAYPSLSRTFHIVRNPYIPDKEVFVPDHYGSEVVFIGKLSPAKGILQTLRVFSRLWAQQQPVKLTLIGDADYYYHAAASTMGAYIRDRYGTYIKQGLLTIRGKLPPQQATREAAQAKIVLVPSTIENLPYVVVENMANKKVVVAAKQGGQQELIEHGRNGFLFDGNSIESFQNAVTQALTLDDGDLKNIGNQAAAAIRQLCDPDHVFHIKMQLLEAYTAEAGAENTFPFVSIPTVKHTIEPSSASVNGLLSVVIPYYNLGNYIDETVNSVLASAYKNIEIIIVDDGSTDTESYEVLKKFRHHEKIRVITQQNQGLATTRNAGAREARGEFLAFLDADDKVTDTYYSKAIALLQEKTNVHFVGTWVQYFDGSQHLWPAFTPEPPYLLFHNMVNSSALVYRRASFLKSGLNDNRFIYGMEDYDSVINLVKNGYGGVVIPEPLFRYRVRKNSMARGFNKSNMSYLYQLLAEKHTVFYATFAAEITSLLNINGPGYQYENPTLDYHIASGSTWRHRLVRKLLIKVKQHPALRKTALRIYQKLKS